MSTGARAVARAWVLLAVLSAGAWAAGAASLSYVSGRVSVERAGRSRPGGEGEAVASGEAVATGPKAAAVVALPDGSRLKLREKSRVVVSYPEKPAGLTEIVLSAGGVFAKAAKQAAGRRFQVRAGTAVAAVRGTEFFTAFGRGPDLWVCVNEGVVDVSAGKAGRGLSLSAGEGVLLKGGSSPGKPQAYDWTKALNWNMEPALGRVEDSTNLDSAYSDLLERDYR